MTPSTIGGLLLLAATAGTAAAQTREQGPHNHLLRDPYVTSTGATVDKPGVPQGSAPTGLDRAIRKQDNAVDDSLCKGC